jgi:hypothetical protein
MPVEAFAKALMRGLGWQEGQGVGRNKFKDVQMKDIVRRPDRLGLGAKPAPPPPERKANGSAAPSAITAGTGGTAPVLAANARSSVPNGARARHFDLSLVASHRCLFF